MRFNVAMITCDLVRVPCLTEGYWATFPDFSGRNLAHVLTSVRDHPLRRPLPGIGQLPIVGQLGAEEENARRCLDFARDQIGLSGLPRASRPDDLSASPR
jgi:hypothetical protein